MDNKGKTCRYKTEIPRGRVPHLSVLEVCSRQGAIQMQVYLTLPVYTGVAIHTQKYYEQFVNPGNIKTVFNLSAGHTFVRSSVRLSYRKAQLKFP